GVARQAERHRAQPPAAAARGPRAVSARPNPVAAGGNPGRARHGSAVWRAGGAGPAPPAALGPGQGKIRVAPRPGRMPAAISPAVIGPPPRGREPAAVVAGPARRAVPTRLG